MILDATCGGRLMYRGLDADFDPTELVFMDIREGTFIYDGPDKRIIHVKPDKIGSVTSIPWHDSSFNLVLFDPPHDNFGASSFMGTKYGSWSRADFVQKSYFANQEFHRVLKPGGLLLAKVQDNEHRDRLLIGQLTRFKLLLKIQQANTSGRATNKTFWLLFVRRSEL